MAEALDLDTIADKLAALCTQREEDVAAYFYTVASTDLAGTAASSRCHFLRREGNGALRVNGLASLLGRKVIDYALPRSEIAAAANELATTGSTAGFVKLTKKAQGLFTHISQSGEGGELLLYLLAEVYLGIPQVISKMHLKTNPQVHYHGVDGVHASLDADTGILALWWGESKLYSRLNSAIGSCLHSIAPFLCADPKEGAAAERDLDLLQAYADLSDPQLLEAFKRYLNPDDPAFNKLQYRGICLIGFDLEEYPNPVGEEPLSFAADVEALMNGWRDAMQGSIQRRKLDQVRLEVFFVPLPCVADLRAAFLGTLGIGQ